MSKDHPYLSREAVSAGVESEGKEGKGSQQYNRRTPEQLEASLIPLCSAGFWHQGEVHRVIPLSVCISDQILASSWKATGNSNKSFILLFKWQMHIVELGQLGCDAQKNRDKSGKLVFFALKQLL